MQWCLYLSGTRVYISLSSKWKGKVQGLCGNFDGNSLNDYSDKDGMTYDSPAQFASTWKTDSTCPDAKPEQEEAEPCEKVPQRRTWAVASCKIIKTGEKFAACRAKVDPERYYQDCLFDSCK